MADIVEEPGAEVWGAVWRIPLAERAALDRQEGLHLDPPHYRRIEVTVTTPDGATLDCLAYQVATREAAHIAPSAAYLGDDAAWGGGGGVAGELCGRDGRGGRRARGCRSRVGGESFGMRCRPGPGGSRAASPR